MQQFQVPQFIAIEDRIIGPVTLKQFLYLLGAAGIAILGWAFLYFARFVIFAVPAAGLFVALAFLKINERPLPTVIFNAIGYYLKPRLYIWRKIPQKRETIRTPADRKNESLLAGAPKLSESKLNDIAWSLDIKENVERGQ